MITKEGVLNDGDGGDDDERGARNGDVMYHEVGR